MCPHPLALASPIPSAGTVSAAVPAIFSGLGHLTDVLLKPKEVVASIMEAGPRPSKWLRELADDYTSFDDVANHYSWVSRAEVGC